MKEKELDEQGRGDLKRYLPERVTVDEIKGRIHSRNDFRRIVGYKADEQRGRSSELGRILKKNNPHALDLEVQPSGVITTQYERKEYKLTKQRLDRRRKQMRQDMETELFLGDKAVKFDEMSGPEYAASVDGTDLVQPDEGEPDTSVEDVDEPTKAKWRAEDARAHAESVQVDAMVNVYLKTWEDITNDHESLPGYQDLIDAIEWMEQHKPRELNKMFNSGADEIDPQWVYHDTWANPYTGIVPFEQRHQRAVRYVTQWARKAGWDG